MMVVDCPTKEMWADIMTNSLQGTAFRLMRAELMNCDVNYEDPPEEEESGPVTSPKMVSGRVLSRQPSKHRRSVLGRTGIWVLGCVLARMVLRCVLARMVLGCVLARIQSRERTLDGVHVECQDKALE